MKKNWIVQPGKISHTAAPRFTAAWDIGPHVLACVSGSCWTSEGTGDDDQLHIYSFSWDDPAPGQDGFERLMQQAAGAIDRFITEGL
ncbi:MAG: hypothetical protein V3V31_16105 [Methylococcales bacterium]